MEGLPRRNEAVQIEIRSFAALHRRREVLVPQPEVQASDSSELPIVLEVVALPPVVHAGGKGLDTDLRAGGEPEQKIGELVVAGGGVPAGCDGTIEVERAARIYGFIERPVPAGDRTCRPSEHECRCGSRGCRRPARADSAGREDRCCARSAACIRR